MTYSVQWSAERNFPADRSASVAGIVWPTYTHSKAVAPGTYFWRYRFANVTGEASEWSEGAAVAWTVKRIDAADTATVEIEIGGRRRSVGFPRAGDNADVQVNLSMNPKGETAID